MMEILLNEMDVMIHVRLNTVEMDQFNQQGLIMFYEQQMMKHVMTITLIQEMDVTKHVRLRSVGIV